MATILIVDDEPVILDVFRRFLEGEGRTLLLAGSAREAMGVAASDTLWSIARAHPVEGMTAAQVVTRAAHLPERVAAISGLSGPRFAAFRPFRGHPPPRRGHKPFTLSRRKCREK